MLHTRQKQMQQEDDFLATYAFCESRSRGRVHDEPPHPWRTAYQRDRDRVIHSSAFRRLEYKTQVFVNGTADHYRTRLTHTMEMAAAARTLARVLRVNEDLTEAICLAHDVGHSPFGHSGERELNAIMEDQGGFDHNLQSLRWMELLEEKYPDFPGLNLTWEVRAGLHKHDAAEPGANLEGFPLGPKQSIEAQIADVADDLAYYAHDVEDGFEAHLITRDQLREHALWQLAETRTLDQYGRELEMPMITRALLDLQVADVIALSRSQLERHKPQTPDDVRMCQERIADFSSEMKTMLISFRAFLFENLYWHPAVDDENREAVSLMRSLFMFYIDHPEAMGRKARARVATEGLWRTVCDYVSGMTDRYALEEVHQHKLS